MKTLWQRYIYKEIIKTATLFLICFFLLYIAIDYSVQMRSFLRTSNLGLIDISFYYAYQFIKRSDLLIPLALLVATIKVLRKMNLQHELLALQVAGLPVKTLLRPFLIIAFSATLLNFGIAEYLLPTSLKFTDNFRQNHLRNQTRKEMRNNGMRVLDLKDGSKLAFEHFNKETTSFHDLFWICSMDEIWRIQSLHLDPAHPNDPPLCLFVDHIKRSSDGNLHRIASYPTIRLEALKPSTIQPKKITTALENSSISQLFRETKKNHAQQQSRLAQISSQLVMKCTRPFLSLLSILLIAPFCLRFSRLSKALPIYTGGIFGIIVCFVGIQAGGILIENQAATPFNAIVIPFLILFGWSTYKFAKL